MELNPSSDIKEHHISTSITTGEKLKEKQFEKTIVTLYRSPIIKLNKAVKNLKKLLRRKVQAYKSAQIYLKHLIMESY
jgi:hypothetical protein